MNSTLDTYKVEEYNPAKYDKIQEYLTELLDASATNFCKSADYADVTDYIYYAIRDAIMKYLDITPAESDPDSYFFHTFRVTYAYFLGSVGLVLLTSVAFLYIVRRHYHDRFEYVRMGWRLLMALIAFGLIFLYFNINAFLKILGSPYVDLIVCFLMASTLVVDRVSRFVGLRRFRKRYTVPPPEPKAHHRDSVATTFGAESINLHDMQPEKSRPVSYMSQNPLSPGASEGVEHRPGYVSVNSEDAMLTGPYGGDLGAHGGTHLDDTPNYQQHTEYPGSYGTYGNTYYDPTRGP